MPFYGLNLSVSLSISLQGFGLQVAEGALPLPPLPHSVAPRKPVQELARRQLAQSCVPAPSSHCCGFLHRPSLAGLLGELPFGSLSIVGARSVEEARRARLAGADSILVKVELVRQYAPDRLGQLMEELRSATDLDD